MKLKAAKSFRIGGMNYARGADVTDISEARARDLQKRGFLTGSLKAREEAKTEEKAEPKPRAKKADAEKAAD